MTDHDTILEPVTTAYRDGRAVALLFDYDGTLVPIVSHPSLARLSAKTRDLLHELSGLRHVALGFLSGRKLDELKALVGLSGVYYAGAAGLELELKGERLTHPQAAKMVADVAASLQQAVSAFAGAWLENKDVALAVHYRDVAPGQAASFRHKIDEIIAPLADQFLRVEGPLALEITPNVGWNKGTAVRRIVEIEEAGVFPVFAGDAANDADALQAAIDLGGLALWIGPETSSITPHRLATPAALLGLLTSILQSFASIAGGQATAS